MRANRPARAIRESRACPAATALLAACLGSACEIAYPEVAVVNETAASVLIKDVSFNGCAWSGVLAYGAATAPARCLPGEDRIHFRKLDVGAYCRKQAEGAGAPDFCACDGGVADAPDGGTGREFAHAEPTWFWYQTVSVRHAGHGGFHLFGVTLDDMEQDFSVPGPYGH